MTGLLSCARLPLACWALGLSVLATSAVAQDKVLRRLDAGSGVDSVGVSEGREEAPATGPAAMYVGDDNKIYLLDQNNGRILSIDPDSNAEPKALDLPTELMPTDLVAVRDQLYVWDGGVHSLKAKEGADQTPGEGTPLEGRSVGGGDALTRSAFAQMGTEALASDADTIQAVGRSLSGPEQLDAPMRQTVATRAKRVVKAEILPAKDGKSALIELRPEDDPLAVTRIKPTVTDKLGSVEVLDVDAKGDVFVFVENVPTEPTARVGIYVARFSSRGRLIRVYDLPITADQIGSRRFVTISPEGRVLFLRSDETGVSIMDLASRTPKKQILEPPPIKVASQESVPFVDPGAGYVTAVRPNSRMGVIQTGLAFEGLKWQVSAANYGADPDKPCAGFPGRVRRPWYLSGKKGQEVRGVPYCWGCFGTVTQFMRRVEGGMLAGNICTKENPRRDTVGLDCSAFVSATWGLQRQYTTLAIPSITQKIANPWDMKPGDAFNKPGSHVMLFVKFTPDRKAEVLEAATGGCNGRVCRNVYPLSALLARGYQPVRYPMLTD